MPTCGRCGEPTPVGAKFCPECGGTLQPTTTRASRSRKTVTIVFSDLVDSTTLGEELDAESLRAVLDDYFEAMRRELDHHGGIVEKFIGDAVMAVFGLPRMREDDAIRAVRAAVGMRAALATLNQDLVTTHGVTLNSRTGVNTGVVVVGDAAGGQRLATGDTVNVAARLEQAAPAGGIVLGPDTFRLVKGHVNASSIGSLKLKGKRDEIAAWQLVGLEPEHEHFLARTRALVGRRSELADVEALLADASHSGRVESVLVVGEAGVGKSRLAAEVVDRLAPTTTVLSARCRPYGTTSFWPVAELLSEVVDSGQELQSADLRALAADLRPEERLAVVERVASMLGLSAASFPLEECFWATGNLFSAIAPLRPLVLVIEDVHWAEGPLLDLLDHLPQHRRPSGALILATARPEVLERNRGGGIRPPHVIDLPALSPAESDGLIDGVLGGAWLSEKARSVIHRASEGNPLFVEQALATWIEEGVLSRGPQGWTATRPNIDVRIPASVAAIFASRLDRLSVEERLVLGAASVAGLTFGRPAVTAMLPHIDHTRLDACLQRLVRAGLLAPARSGGADADSMAFLHASLRDVAYDLTLKSDRAALHERFADWVESADDRPPVDGLIGYHVAEAYKYRTELRMRDSHTIELALRGAQRLVPACERTLGIGDQSGAARLTSRIIELLHACGPEVASTDLPLMERTAKLLVTMGRWHETVALLSSHTASGRGPLLRDLGVALCQIHRSLPHSAEYREGQRLLEAACAPPNRDLDALASLAGTWKGVDDSRAEAYYRRCLDLDPADPYALGNVVEYDITAARDLSVMHHMRESIVEAKRRCRDQAAAGVNLPWAFFDAGKFALLSGHPYEAMAAYAKAVQLTTSEHVLVTSMASLRRIEAAGGEVTGSAWAQDLLALARAVRFPSTAAAEEPGDPTPLTVAGRPSRVVVLAGGTDATVEGWLGEHRATLLAGFADFAGVVISGGTDHGVAGLAGSLREHYGRRIAAIGYLPADLPAGATVDTRYDDLRQTVERGFSIAQALKSWTEMMASQVTPADVKLLAINGGEIAGAEYRIALALGCTVGVVVGSGREADRLLNDLDWVAAPNLVRLEPDVEAISGFLSLRGPDKPATYDG